MKKSLFISILILLGISMFRLSAQAPDKYDLLTEPFIERPFTQHNGILKLTASYNHILGNNYFDGEGNRLEFNEIVRSLIEDDYHLEIRYGLLELLEINTGISYRNRYETLPTYFVSNNASFGSENTLFHYRGFSNLAAGLRFRSPVFGPGIELYVSSGMILPFPGQDPDQPEHSIDLYDPSDPGGSYELTYRFNPAAGIPGTSYEGGFGARYRNKKFRATVESGIRQAISEVETYSWNYRLYGSEFEFYKLPYTIFNKGNMWGSANIDLQLYPWFAIFSGYMYAKETPGWSDQSGQPVSLTRASAGTMLLGFDIQVSTHFRLLQQVWIPLHGTYSFSEFAVKTGITYSLAP